MGTYISYSDVIERFPGEDATSKLTRLKKLTGTADETTATAAVNAAITLAEGKIEGYAAVLYETPLPANEMTANWALCIVEYELYKRSAFGEVQEKYVKAYDDCISELKQLAAGKLTVSGATQPTGTSRGSGPMLVVSDEPMFDADNFVGW